jgi:hypothetical protein
MIHSYSWRLLSQRKKAEPGGSAFRGTESMQLTQQIHMVFCLGGMRMQKMPQHQ